VGPLVGPCAGPDVGVLVFRALVRPFVGPLVVVRMLGAPVRALVGPLEGPPVRPVGPDVSVLVFGVLVTAIVDVPTFGDARRDTSSPAIWTSSGATRWVLVRRSLTISLTKRRHARSRNTCCSTRRCVRVRGGCTANRWSSP
jgi:hypothetical protein